MTTKPVLLFISTRFLFPADSGGKIRTSQILRGLTGGSFRIRLLMPCDTDQREQYAQNIASVCDELIPLPSARVQGGVRGLLRRFLWLFRTVPIPVMADWNRTAQAVIETELAHGADVVVFDFPHSAILAPDDMRCPTVMFTHNIEAEIFKRHMQVARSPAHRWLWRNQYRKMLRFERSVLAAFDAVIAVSERDCEFFRTDYGARHCYPIPTGVDTEFLAYHPPEDRYQVVFCGSMDWMANIDGVEFFHDRVWPLIRRSAPDARMKVVGRTPPDELSRRIRDSSPEWEFTGFVDDVRDHVPGSAVFVIPLRVGGGTRIKAFEAMAMGCPVVSTSIGIEGLPVEDGVHFLRADTEQEFAQCVTRLLHDEAERRSIAEAARRLVEEQFGFQKAARVFEAICLRTAELDRQSNSSTGGG